MSREDLMDPFRRAIQRAAAMPASDLKKGISALATIGSTAPFVGLLGTVVGVINAFQGIGAAGLAGHRARPGRILGTPVGAPPGLGAAIPAGWVCHYPPRRVQDSNSP